jgi:hypothetical protein
MFDHFWDFDRLVKDEAPGEAEIISPPFVGFLGVYVTCNVGPWVYPCLGLICNV